MKNIIKKIGIIAFIAVMGLGLFTSCEEPEEASLTVGSGAKTTLTITGIPNEHNGKFASGGIADTVTDDAYVFLAASISGGSITAAGILNKNSSPVSLDGTGHVVLFIDTTGNPQDPGQTYTGVVYSKTISPGNNTIAFSEFIKQ